MFNLPNRRLRLARFMDFYEICLRLDSDFEGVLLFFMFEKKDSTFLSIIIFWWMNICQTWEDSRFGR